VIEPLKSLLEKLRKESADGFILQNGGGKPLSLDSLNTRVITPAMKKAVSTGTAIILAAAVSAAMSPTQARTRSTAPACYGIQLRSPPSSTTHERRRNQSKGAMRQIEQKALDLMAKETVQ